MTERLYYTSDATECPARVVNCLGEADGRYAIELDRTLFHPPWLSPACVLPVRC